MPHDDPSQKSNVLFIDLASPVLRRVDNNPNDSQYHYVPTEYVCAIFVALYGLSTCKRFTLVIIILAVTKVVLNHSDTSGPGTPLSNAVAVTNSRSRWSGGGSGMERQVMVISKSTTLYSLYDPVSRTAVVSTTAVVDMRSSEFHAR